MVFWVAGSGFALPYPSISLIIADRALILAASAGQMTTPRQIKPSNQFAPCNARSIHR